VSCSSVQGLQPASCSHGPFLTSSAAGLSLIALDQSRNKRMEPTYRNILLVM
jgi:hypothetical protein